MQDFTRLLICFLLMTGGLYAQEALPTAGPGAIKGQLLNEQNEPIAYASVSVLQPSGELVAGGISNEQGRFELSSLALGNYQVDIQFLGYANWQQSIELNTRQKTLRLGDIQLSPDQALLDEVVVTAEKSQYQFELDRRVFNVGKDVLTDGSTALDVLDQVPQVAVEPNGAVTLRGSSQVQIMINGRRSGLTLNNALEQIPGENIERIEVITNPAASFSANGAAGIINIILKKNQEYGLKAELRATAGAPANHMLLPSFTYKQDRINLFGNYRWRYSDYNGRYETNQFSTLANDLTSLRKAEREDRHDDGRSFYVGGDYLFSDNTTLTIAYFRADTKDTDETALGYTATDAEGAFSQFIRNGNSVEDRDYNQLEANFTHDFARRGQQLRVDFQYDFWNSLKNWELNTTGDLPADVPVDLRTRNRSASDDYVLEVNYRHPQGDNGRWETGVKLENRLINNDYLAEEQIDGDWVVFQQLDNLVDYEERVGAAFLQYAYEAGKWEFQTGVRSEIALIEIADRENTFSQEKDFYNLFPSAAIGYKSGEKTSIQLSYSRRINRPYLWDLYPFFEVRDVNLLETGNPQLNPSFSNSFELGLTHRQEQWSITPSVYLRQTDDPFQSFIQQDDAGMFQSFPVNIDEETTLGAELSWRYQPVRALRLSGEFNYRYFDQEGSFEGANLSATGSNWNTRIGANLRLPKQLRVNVRYQFRGGQREAQFRYFSSSDLSISASKAFLEDRFSVSVNAFNILDTRIGRSEAVLGDTRLEQVSRRIGARYSLTLVYKINQTEKDRMRYQNRGNR